MHKRKQQMDALYTIIFATIVIMSVSCSTEELDESSPEQVLTVSAMSETIVSEISSDKNQCLWEKGDNFSLHIAGNKNIRMELADGAGSTTGTFTGVIASNFTDVDMATAIYPYCKVSSYSDGGGLKGVFPGTQKYSRLAAVMVGLGYPDKDGAIKMNFRNAFAVLKFSLTGSGESISQISVESENGETMSGEFLITDFNSLEPIFYGADSKIVLCASDSSPLSESPLVFEMTVPAICYECGLKIKIQAEDSYMERVIGGSQELILERNHTYDLGNFQYVPEKITGENKIKRLHVISQSGFFTGSTDTKYAYMLLISSLQGLLNASGKDAIYLQTTNDLDWSDILGKSAEEVIRWGSDYKGMIRALLPELCDKKYILMEDFSPEGTSWITDKNEEKLAIATSYAAAHQAIILQECIVEDELFSGFRCIEDVRGKTMEDVYDLFISEQELFAKDGIISVPRIPHRNVDMAIRHRWVSIKSDDEILTGRFFSEIQPLSPRFSYNGPYGNEGLDVRFSSSYDLYALAAGWCSNISTHERMLSMHTDREVNKRRYRVDYDRQDVHYVCILMSDGGNLEYFDKKFRECFEHENFGKFPISFMMTPALKKYKPAIQQWYMDHISDNCSFITSISGLGDIYPSFMTSDEVRSEFGRLTAAAMEDEGQTLFAIMDRREDESYTWEYLMNASRPIIENIPQCKGVIFLGYAYIWDGTASFVNGVPVVSIKYSCFYSNGLPMDDPNNPKSQKKVADSIKKQPKNPKIPEGYSIVLFNANPPDISPKPVIMEDVQKLVDYLKEDPRIEIVNASQFFDLYNYHLGSAR